MDVIILPDIPVEVADVASGLPAGRVRIIRYPSGRPWIMGLWDDDEQTIAPTETGTLVILGLVGASRAAVNIQARHIRQFRDSDRLFEHVPGCYLTLLCAGGQSRAHGTLSAVHKLFYTSARGYTVASNKANILRRAFGTSMRKDLLPLLLLAPRAPWPHTELTMWQGVESVPSTHALALDRAGRHSLARRWKSPSERNPLSEVSPPLRSALERAVAARADKESTVSADLSGGMDSTSLAFLANEHARHLVTVRQDARDVTNDDAQWANVAHQWLPSATHLVVDANDAPTWYTHWDDPFGEDLGEPYPALRTVATTRNLARLVRSHGATMHINGLGGDELFSPSFAHIHALFRVAPAQALGALSRTRAMGRWGALESLIGIVGSPSRRSWSRQVSESLTSPLLMRPRLQWEPEPRLPDWASASAVDAARQLLTAPTMDDTATGARAVDFEMLRLIVADGTLVRRMSQVMELDGVSYQAPFLDDQVVDLAFRVQLEDRIQPGQYKPVLQAAVVGVVPAELLNRRSKGDYSAEAYAGLKANRASMSQAFEDSTLERLGLIDGAAVQRFLTAVHPDTRPFRFLDPTLGAETWLRAIADDCGGSHQNRTGGGYVAQAQRAV